jgi:hypothetical protein
MTGDIDADFPHRLYRFRPHVTRFYTGALNVEGAPAVVAQDSFRHLTPSRIPSAKDQDPLFIHCRLTSSGILWF